jgi:hypothetical protein
MSMERQGTTNSQNYVGVFVSGQVRSDFDKMQLEFVSE